VERIEDIMNFKKPAIVWAILWVASFVAWAVAFAVEDEPVTKTKYVVGQLDQKSVVIPVTDNIEIHVIGSPLQGYQINVTVVPIWCVKSDEEPDPEELPAAKDNCLSCHEKETDDKFKLDDKWFKEAASYEGGGDATRDKGHKKHVIGDRAMQCSACHKI
jgi:hypothetical protein